MLAFWHAQGHWSGGFFIRTCFLPLILHFIKGNSTREEEKKLRLASLMDVFCESVLLVKVVSQSLLNLVQMLKKISNQKVFTVDP